MFDYGRNSLTIEETLPDKEILEKLKGEGKGWAFYIVANKLNPKHLIRFRHLRTYINPTRHDGHARNPGRHV